MATLHTVNKSPFSTQSLISCLGHAKDGDTVLMIEDAVFGAKAATGLSDMIAARTGPIKICALLPDLQARGVDADRLIDGIVLVDYAGFVELAASADLTQAWL